MRSRHPNTWTPVLDETSGSVGLHQHSFLRQFISCDDRLIRAISLCQNYNVFIEVDRGPHGIKHAPDDKLLAPNRSLAIVKNNSIKSIVATDSRPFRLVRLHRKIDISKKSRRISFRPVVNKNSLPWIKVIDEIAGHVKIVKNRPLNFFFAKERQPPRCSLLPNQSQRDLDCY